MSPQQTTATATLIRPDEAFELPAADRVAIGERVTDMLDTQAWADLKQGIRAKQATIASLLMGQPGDKDRGVLAKLTGEMTGVAALELIAAELIADGERAGQEIRTREEDF